MEATDLDLRVVLECLARHFGKQGWWPAESTLEIVLGAILVQRTAWRNAEKALEQLRTRHLIDHRALASIPVERLERLLRNSGFYKRKARTVQGFARFLALNHAGSLESLFSRPTVAIRAELLQLEGIGPETADSILLYAADRKVLPIDAYARRVLNRLGIADAQALPYERLQDKVHRSFLGGLDHFKELRALMVKLGKTYCGREPECAECPLLNMCQHGQKTPNACRD